MVKGEATGPAGFSFLLHFDDHVVTHVPPEAAML